MKYINSTAVADPTANENKLKLKTKKTKIKQSSKQILPDKKCSQKRRVNQLKFSVLPEEEIWIKERAKRFGSMTNYILFKVGLRDAAQANLALSRIVQPRHLTRDLERFAERRSYVIDLISRLDDALTNLDIENETTKNKSDFDARTVNPETLDSFLAAAAKLIGEYEGRANYDATTHDYVQTEEIITSTQNEILTAVPTINNEDHHNMLPAACPNETSLFSAEVSTAFSHRLSGVDLEPQTSCEVSVTGLNCGDYSTSDLCDLSPDGLRERADLKLGLPKDSLPAKTEQIVFSSKLESTIDEANTPRVSEAPNRRNKRISADKQISATGRRSDDGIHQQLSLAFLPNDEFAKKEDIVLSDENASHNSDKPNQQSSEPVTAEKISVSENIAHELAQITVAEIDSLVAQIKPFR